MKNYFNLSGQTAIITGASTGLGVQMAKALANQGCNIVCLARRQALVEENAASLEKEFGVKALGIACDITDTESVNISRFLFGKVFFPIVSHHLDMLSTANSTVS